MSIVKHEADVEKEEVTLEGVKNCKIQWLLREEEGMPNFQMRRITIEKNGSIPLHTHPWEHEIFFLSGEGVLLEEQKETLVRAGDVAYVDGTKLHGFRNPGKEEFVFLCMIPIINE